MTSINRFPASKWPEAMADLMLDIEGIVPGAKHDFAKYRYTTADQLFDQIRPLLAKHGFTLFCDECKVEITDISAKSGGRLVLSTFAMWFEYGGERVGEIERMTVGNAVTSPQSLCASRTYAVKYYLRNKLLININEKDEDQIGQNQADRIRDSAFDPRARSKRQPTIDDRDRDMAEKYPDNPNFKQNEGGGWTPQLPSTIEK